MSWRPRLPSKPFCFAVLMILAAVLALLPSAWTVWARGVVQVLGLPQWALSSGVRGVKQAVGAAGEPPITPEVARQIQIENEELRRLLRQQEMWLWDLEQRYEEVSGIRGQLGELGGEILIAPVLGYDASPRRETMLIGRGELANVRPGQWVAAGVSRARRSGQQTGRQVLMRQWLIGRVSEVQSHVSRVQLASDLKFREPVYVGRVLDDGRWQRSAAKYVLSGGGRGRMFISPADADYAGLGYELVLAPPSADLPIMLSVGRIVSSTPLEESALHFNLEIEPWGDPRDLRYVYIVLPGS